MIGLISIILAVAAFIMLLVARSRGNFHLSPKFLLIGFLLACSCYFIFYYSIVLNCGRGTDISYCEGNGKKYGLELALPVGFALFGWISVIVNKRRGR